MSERRRLLSRPRTKVYDCNYNIGEGYYRPVVDQLDRKRSGRSSASPLNTSSLADRLSADIRSRRADDTSFSDRQASSNLLDDYDSMLDSRSRKSTQESSRAIRSTRSLDQDDGEFEASLDRIRSARQARVALEEELESSSNRRQQRPRLDVSDRLLSSVGIKSSDVDNFFDESTSSRRSRLSGRNVAEELDDDSIFKRRGGRKTQDVDDVQEPLKKLTALRLRGDDDSEVAAQARARKSRNRIAELEAEMDERLEKTAARAARRAQIGLDMSASADSSSVSSVRVKQVMQTEKKTVTF